MPVDLHERARLLMDRAVAEGVSPEEQRWLASHLSQCGACSAYSELSQRTICALQSFAFEMDPAAALHVQRAVRSRTARMASQGRGFAAGIPIAIALTIVGSIAAWGPAAWLAGRWNVPAPVWQAGFAILWLLPSVVLDVLLLFRGKLIGDNSGGEGDAV